MRGFSGGQHDQPPGSLRQTSANPERLDYCDVARMAFGVPDTNGRAESSPLDEVSPAQPGGPSGQLRR